jgi:hypothetical protein
MTMKIRPYILLLPHLPGYLFHRLILCPMGRHVWQAWTRFTDDCVYCGKIKPEERAMIGEK